MDKYKGAFPNPSSVVSNALLSGKTVVVVNAGLPTQEVFIGDVASHIEGFPIVTGCVLIYVPIPVVPGAVFDGVCNVWEFVDIGEFFADHHYGCYQEAYEKAHGF